MAKKNTSLPYEVRNVKSYLAGAVLLVGVVIYAVMEGFDATVIFGLVFVALFFLIPQMRRHEFKNRFGIDIDGEPEEPDYPENGLVKTDMTKADSIESEDDLTPEEEFLLHCEDYLPEDEDEET